MKRSCLSPRYGGAEHGADRNFVLIVGNFVLAKIPKYIENVLFLLDERQGVERTSFAASRTEITTRAPGGLF